MLTIATTPRPLDNEFNQRGFKNAVMSWDQIRPRPQIIVFGNVPSRCMTSTMELVLHYPREPDGRPYFNSFIDIAEEAAIHEVVMYVTDHLIFLPGLKEVVELVCSRLDRFLLMGRRWEADFDQLIDFTRVAWPNLLNIAIQHTQELGSIGAKDWLAWKKPFPAPIPPFIMGIPWYDTWMAVRAEELGIPRVDATLAIKAVHPRHGFPFAGGIKGRQQDPRWELNHQLALGCEHRGHVTEAEWVVVHNTLVRRKSFRGE